MNRIESAAEALTRSTNTHSGFHQKIITFPFDLYTISSTKNAIIRKVHFRKQLNVW